MIAIIDYGVGNLFSLACSLKAIGAECEVTGSADRILKADRVILPGVGAFGDAQAKLFSSGLYRAALARAESKAGRATGSGGSGGGEALTARELRELEAWNRAYPQLKMTAREFLSR